jgi:hypothetical protein
MNLVERFRGQVVSQILMSKSFAPTWNDRRDRLARGIPSNPSGGDIVSLGENLAEAQVGNRNQGRSQSSVSVAGHSWQSLVILYLNMIYAGTEAVAVSSRFTPTSVKNAMKVSYSGPTIGGDIDAALLVLPKSSTVNEPGGGSIDEQRKNSAKLFASSFDKFFTECHVSLIACKTNWNDLMQVPMLWSLLYGLRAASATMPGGLSIGSGGNSIDQLAGFNMAFFTVPTGDLFKIKSSSVQVQRSRVFNGGYFWGFPTVRNLVQNISEFPDRQSSIGGGLIPPSGNCGEAFASAINGEDSLIDFAAYKWDEK